MAQDEAHATTGAQDTLVAVWQGDPSAERIVALGDQLRAVARRNAGRVYLYNIITTSTPIPSPAARSALQAQFASMRGQLIAAAIVLEKTGAEGALARAILNTVVTVTRQPFPMRVFAVRRDAVTWLGGQGCGMSGSAMSGLADGLIQRLRG
jgi:hypothetical protein